MTDQRAKISELMQWTTPSAEAKAFLARVRAYGATILGTSYSPLDTVSGLPADDVALRRLEDVLLVWPVIDTDLNRPPRQCSSTAGKRICNFISMDSFEQYRHSTLLEIKQNIAATSNRNNNQWVCFLRICDCARIGADGSSPAEQYRRVQDMMNVAMTKILRATADGGNGHRPFVGVHVPLFPEYTLAAQWGLDLGTIFVKAILEGWLKLSSSDREALGQLEEVFVSCQNEAEAEHVNGAIKHWVGIEPMGRHHTRGLKPVDEQVPLPPRPGYKLSLPIAGTAAETPAVGPAPKRRAGSTPVDVAPPRSSHTGRPSDPRSGVAVAQHVRYSTGTGLYAHETHTGQVATPRPRPPPARYSSRDDAYARDMANQMFHATQDWYPQGTRRGRDNWYDDDWQQHASSRPRRNWQPWQPDDQYWRQQGGRYDKGHGKGRPGSSSGK